MPTKSASCSLRHLLQKKFLCGTKGVIVSKDIKYEEAAQAGCATSRVFNSPKRHGLSGHQRDCKDFGFGSTPSKLVGPRVCLNHATHFARQGENWRT